MANTIRNRALPNLSVNTAPKSLHGVNLNNALFAHLQRNGIGAQELTAGHNTTTRSNPMSDHVAKSGSKAKNGAGRDTKKTGTYKGKSNALGHGGRAQQLKDRGVPGGVIGEIARRKQAAPGQKNYHGGKK